MEKSIINQRKAQKIFLETLMPFCYNTCDKASACLYAFSKGKPVKGFSFGPKVLLSNQGCKIPLFTILPFDITL